MKNKRKYTSAALLVGSLFAASAASAVVISIDDFSFTPNGTNDIVSQVTDVQTPNGGVVLPASGTPTVYFVTTFTFGVDSQARLRAQFLATGGQDRLGVEVLSTGVVQTTGGTTENAANLGNMSGQTVTLLVKLSYDADNNITYGFPTQNARDTLMNVWVNPDENSVEGSGLTAGDVGVVWNSTAFGSFRQQIQNQSTPDTAGASSILNTTILTGDDATFANALAVIPEPSTAVLGALGLLALLRRRRA